MKKSKIGLSMGDGTQSTTILLIVAKKHPPRSKRGGYFFGRAQSLNLMTLGLDRTSFCIVSCLLLLVAVQYRYSLVEGFYWFNGGIYYTFFYAVALVLLGLCLLLLKESKKTLFTCYLVLSCALAFLVGGGNYTTALTVLLLLFFCLLVLLLRKNKKAVWIGVVLLFLLLSFFLSVLAPGNAIRQESAGSPNAVKQLFFPLFTAHTVSLTPLPFRLSSYGFFCFLFYFMRQKRARFLSAVPL